MASGTRGILVYLTLPLGSAADELDRWSVYLHLGGGWGPPSGSPTEV